MKQIENTAWANTDTICKACLNNTIVFWGAGSWVEKTMTRLGLVPDYIVDNNQTLQGHLQNNIEIISYDKLKSLNTNYTIIITTGSYLGLEKFLLEEKFIPGKDYFFSPLLQNIKIRNDMLTIDVELLFTVPAHPNDAGGLYQYNTKQKQYKRLYAGKTRVAEKINNEIFIVDEMEGVIVLDEQYNIKRKYAMLQNSTTCGLAVSSLMNKLFVANSGRDSVSVFDLDSCEHLEEITISEKFARTGEEHHHINDIYIDEHTKSLYISMFSFSGNWKNNCFDGGVLDYDLEEKRILGPIISDMWMPHSITCVHNNIYLVDSMRGDLYKTSNQVIGNFQGFVRGLAIDDNIIYIGQSSHRHFNRLQETALNIPLNCGIHIFDEITKASVFHPLPEFENVHTIIKL